MQGSKDDSTTLSSGAPFAVLLGVALGLFASGVARGQSAGPSAAVSASGGGSPSDSGADGTTSGSSGAAPTGPPSSGAAPGPTAGAVPSSSASSASPAASGAPSGSSSAEPAPAASPSEAPPEPSSSPSGEGSAPPAFPAEAIAIPGVAAAPSADRARAAEPARSPLMRLEGGGSVSQGLDATDAATRSGGFYMGGIYPIARDFVLTGRYAFSSGHVVERLPGNRLGQFAVPNDVDVLETRHSIGADVGYVGRLTEGSLRAFVMPLVGPRVAFFSNDVAPRWAFEADLALRAGLWATDALEASAFVAFDPAMAKAGDLPDVQGSVLSELRFGVGSFFYVKGPLGVSLGYEGDVVMLEHERLSSHSLLLGFTYALESEGR